MTIAAARTRMIDIVQAVTPSTSAGTRGARKFRHQPRPSGVASENMPDTGAFWLDVAGPLGLRATPIHQAHPRRVQIEWQLSVVYRGARDGDKLDLAIAEDYSSIAQALASPLNWQQNSTGIVTLAMGEPLFPSRIDDVDGASVLRISIPSEVQP